MSMRVEDGFGNRGVGCRRRKTSLIFSYIFWKTLMHGLLLNDIRERRENRLIESKISAVIFSRLCICNVSELAN